MHRHDILKMVGLGIEETGGGPGQEGPGIVMGEAGRR